LRHIDAFLAMSEFSRRKHREFGFPREMTVLPYFLPDPEPQHESEATQPPHPRPYFLFVGRLERLKGLDEVIPLFRRYPDADLLIAGDGQHAGVLKELASGLPQIRFLGRIDVESLKEYYRHAIAAIVPSVTFETFGIVLIEAFKHATPVIARRIGPFPEIVEQAGAGELFDTPSDLLAAMHALQNDPGRRHALGRAGYAAYRARWSESAVVPQYLDIVAEIAGRHAGAAPVRQESIGVH
jgi:glycosyltransferase involved in cell wall biosynthesis